MPRISKKPQVKQSHAVSTVSFQAHAFSDGESIHLKLLWRARFHKLDAQQPSGHPYLHARARAPFRIKPEAAGEVGLPRGCGRHAVRESTPAWSGIEVDGKSARVRGGHRATRGRLRRSKIRGRFAAGMFFTGPEFVLQVHGMRGRRGGGELVDDLPMVPSSTANAQSHEHEPPSAIPARCNEYRPQHGQFASGGRPANLLERDVRTDAMRWP